MGRCCPRGLGTVGVGVSPQPPAAGRTWPRGCSAHACNGGDLGSFAFPLGLSSEGPSRLRGRHPASQEERWLSDPALISFGPVTLSPCLSLPSAEQLLSLWGRICKTESDELGEAGPVFQDRDVPPRPRPLFFSHPRQVTSLPVFAKTKQMLSALVWVLLFFCFFFFNCSHQDNGNLN